MKEIIVWFKIILPPLFLIPLLFVPFDMLTAILWFVAFVVFVKSIASLAKSIYRRVRGKKQFQKELIRPALAIIIIILDVMLIVASQNSADTFARHVANIAQGQCKKNDKCPDRVDGMEFVENGLSKISYGDYGAKYPVTYKVSEDKKSFGVTVRHSIDSFLTIKGGVENEIEEMSELY